MLESAPGRTEKNMVERTWTLTDVSDATWLENFTIHSSDLNLPEQIRWTVSKRTLRGGLQDGVEIVELDNGDLRFIVLPTRGMGIWKAHYRGMDVGWDAPVRGPVHPKWVNLQDRNGLGWLQGFDEWIVRCGLHSMGAPGLDSWTTAEGESKSTPLTLHGRIANLPAYFLQVTAETEAPYRISLTGRVEESMLFYPRLELRSTITTWPHSNRLLIEDQVTNSGSQPSEMQLLYHCNFGPPLLGDGAGLKAPVLKAAPREPYPAESVRNYRSFEKPGTKHQEEVFFLELAGEGPKRRSLAVLHDAARQKAVAVRFSLDQLPCFTLWKLMGSERDGYVVGLEPGTSYPNLRSLEREQGRVRVLQPGETASFELEIEIHDQAADVSRLIEEVRQLETRRGE